MPLFGRSVIRITGSTLCPGARSSRACFTMLASRMTASYRANPMPMQTLGPAPKGR